jgi:glucose-1-phosphate thymidylyltransferase
LKCDEKREVIGLVPAAGKATRLSPLPCSKEIFPVGFRGTNERGEIRPKVVCHYLLECMHLAGISKAYIILRGGKWDIPSYLGDGEIVSMDLGYLIMNRSLGVPFTLDQAHPFVRSARIALGFPDILFSPGDAFSRLLEQQEVSGAEVVLGLFPSPSPERMDMVELDLCGRVRGIQIKPSKTDLHYTWTMAVWSPMFTEFMHEYTRAALEGFQDTDASRSLEHCEIHVSDVILAAMENGISVDSVAFPEGHCLDIGSPEDLKRAVQMGVSACMDSDHMFSSQFMVNDKKKRNT